MHKKLAFFFLLCVTLSGCADSKRSVLPQRSLLPASARVSPPLAKESSDSKRPQPSPAATVIDQRIDPNVKQIQDLMDRASAMFDEAERLSRDGKLIEAKRRLKETVDLVQSSSFSTLQYPQLERFYLNLKRDASTLEASLAEETNLTRTAEDKPDQHLEAAAVDALPNINLYQIKVHPLLVSTVSEELRSVRFGIPISLNDRVLRMLEYYQNRWHDAMQHGLHESGTYMPLFQQIFDEAGVPRELIHVAQVESLYK